MRKFLLGTAVLAVAKTASAFAADILTNAPVYKAPVVAPVEYSWTGCYIGVNVGGKWAHDQGSVNPTPVNFRAVTSTGFPFPLDDHPSNSLAGGEVGCNYQSGHFVFGIEQDIDAQRWSASRVVTAADLPPPTAASAPLFIPGDNFSVTSRWQASIRGRLGYAWDRWMIYATGGIGFTDVQLDSNFIPITVSRINFPATFVNDSQTFAGPTAGAGFEYAFWNNVSLGVEGRYTWYGSRTFNSGAVAAIATAPTTFIFSPVTTSLNLNTWEATARLNWKFD